MKSEIITKLGGKVYEFIECYKELKKIVYIPRIKGGKIVGRKTIENYIKLFVISAKHYEVIVLRLARMTELLSTLKLKIIRAENGLDAVRICAGGNPPDLVLMDIKMPVMNGFDALKIIRDKIPDLPVIAQTAYALVDDKDRIIQAGFDDYITKPIQKALLLDIIGKYMI